MTVVCWVVRTYKICLPQQLQMRNTVFSTIVTVLYTRSPALTHLIKGSLNPLIISPHHTPVPGNYKSVLYFWVQFFQVPHTSEIIQYLSCSVWPISLSITPSKLSHVVVNARCPSFFYGWIYIHHIFFIQLFVDGHLNCFCILAVVNNTAMFIGV